MGVSGSQRPRRGRLAEVIESRGGKAPPEAPFVIEHREALIYMLYEAAELEHGIMLQYLFAVFSLKQSADEGLTEDELAAVQRWRKVVAHVATEEMLHLALVQNLLSAIGSAPHFSRPNLPAPASHYPAGVRLALLPFGDRALRHFMFLERPEGMALRDAKGLEDALALAAPVVDEADIVPRGQDFATIGHLYRSIEHGIVRLAEKFGERRLFVGPARAQATQQDWPWPELVAVTDVASAQRALDTILEQGEGARGHWETAHFGQFVQILDEYRQMKAANPAFDPIRPVLPSKVRPAEDEEGGPAHHRSADGPLRGSVQRRQRGAAPHASALLRAHRGDRRAALDAGARGNRPDGPRAPAARRPHHDAAGRPRAPGPHGGAELRAVLRQRLPGAPSRRGVGGARGAPARRGGVLRRPPGRL